MTFDAWIIWTKGLRHGLKRLRAEINPWRYDRYKGDDRHWVINNPCGAVNFALRSPSGVIYRGTNISKFVRDHPELFVGCGDARVIAGRLACVNSRDKYKPFWRGWTAEFEDPNGEVMREDRRRRGKNSLAGGSARLNGQLYTQPDSATDY